MKILTGSRFNIMRQMGDAKYDGILQMGVNSRELAAKFEPAAQQGEKCNVPPQYTYENMPQQQPKRADYDIARLQQQMQQVQL